MDVVKGFAKRVSGSSNNTKSTNFAKNIDASSENALRHEKNASAALDRSKNLSKMASQEHRDGFASNINVDQDKYEWLTNKFANGDMSKEEYDSALSNQITPEKLKYNKQFEEEVGGHMVNYFNENGCNSKQDIIEAYNHAKGKIQNVDGSHHKQKVLNKAGDLANKDVDNSKLQNKVEGHIGKQNETIKTKGDGIKGKYENVKQNVEKKQDENMIVNLAENTLTNGFEPVLKAARYMTDPNAPKDSKTLGGIVNMVASHSGLSGDALKTLKGLTGNNGQNQAENTTNIHDNHEVKQQKQENFAKIQQESNVKLAYASDRNANTSNPKQINVQKAEQPAYDPETPKITKEG